MDLNKNTNILIHNFLNSEEKSLYELYKEINQLDFETINLKTLIDGEFGKLLEGKKRND